MKWRLDQRRWQKAGAAARCVARLPLGGLLALALLCPRARGAEVPVLHLVELLDRAYGQTR